MNTLTPHLPSFLQDLKVNFFLQIKKEKKKTLDGGQTHVYVFLYVYINTYIHIYVLQKKKETKKERSRIKIIMEDPL